MTNQERRLVAILAERQAQAGLTDPAWARFLGITQSHWWRMRHGQRGIGRRVARRIVTRYPELRNDLHDVFLGADSGEED